MNTFGVLTQQIKRVFLSKKLGIVFFILVSSAQAATTALEGRVTKDTTVRWNGSTSADRDTQLLVKLDTFSYKRVSYVEVELPDMVYADDAVDTFELDLYVRDLNRATTVRVLLEPETVLGTQMTRATAPYSGLDVGQFNVSSSDKGGYLTVELDKSLILEQIRRLSGEKRTLVLRLEGAKYGPRYIASFSSLDGPRSQAPKFRVIANADKLAEYQNANIERVELATITEATYVDKNGAHHSNNELFVKNASFDSNDDNQIGYIEVQVPAAMYTSDIVKLFKLRLFKIAAKENANISVYLAQSANDIGRGTTLSNLPALGQRLGGFSVSANKEHEFIETDLDASALLQYIQNNPSTNRKILLGLKMDEVSPTNIISFASDNYIADFRPQLSVGYTKDVIIGASQPVLMASVTGNTYVRDQSVKSYDTSEELKIKSNPYLRYRRSTYIEMELPSEKIDSNDIDQLTLNLYQISATSSFDAPIYVTAAASLPKGFTTYQGPNPVAQVGTLRVKGGEHKGFIRADLDVEKVMKQVKAIGADNKKIVLRIHGSSTSNHDMAVFSSTRNAMVNTAPNISVSLKHSTGWQRDNIKYLNIIATSDQPNESAMNITEFQVGSSDGKSFTVGTRNIISRGPVRTFNNGSIVQQSVVVKLPEALSSVNTVAVQHGFNSRGNDAVVQYSVLGSSDGVHYDALGYANRHIDTADHSERLGFVDLQDANFEKGYSEVVAVRERNSTAYYKSQWIHSPRFRYDVAALEVSETTYVDVLVPDNLPSGSNPGAMVMQGSRRKGYTLKPGLNKVKVPSGHTLGFTVGIPRESSNKRYDFKYRARTGTAMATLRDGVTTNEAFVHMADLDQAKNMMLLGNDVVFLIPKERMENNLTYWRTLDMAKTISDYNNVFAPIVRYVHGITPDAALRENREDDAMYYYRTAEGKWGLAAASWWIAYGQARTGRVFDQSNGLAHQTIGYWGMAHEIGHGYQNKWFMQHGMGEVVCNIPAIAMRAYTIGPETTFKSFEAQSLEFIESLKTKNDFIEAPDFSKVTMFQQLFALYGEEIFRDLHRVHRDVLKNEYTQNGKIVVERSAENKAGHLAYITSKITKRNMIDYFDGLKFNLNSNYRAKINALGYPAGPSKEVASMTPYAIYKAMGLPDTAYDFKDLATD